MNQTNKPVIRIPHQHLIFVTEVIKHGNKEKAYNKAYPNAQPQSRKPAACRLYNRPEIKQLIDEGRATAAEKAYAKAVQEATGTIEDELLSTLEKRRELARIVRRQQRMSRCYKFKDHVEVKEIPVDNPATILRAIELDTKLEARYFPQTPAEEQEAENPTEQQDHLFPKHPEGPEKIQMYLDKEPLFSDDKYSALTDEQYDYLIKLSLTDKRVWMAQPSLTGREQTAGCWIEQNPETGKYETVCPAENAWMLQDEDTDAEQVTSINNNPSQPPVNQSIQEKKQYGDKHNM